MKATKCAHKNTTTPKPIKMSELKKMCLFIYLDWTKCECERFERTSLSQHSTGEFELGQKFRRANVLSCNHLKCLNNTDARFLN